MEDWFGYVNKFLAFSAQEILEKAGEVSHEMAVGELRLLRTEKK